MAKALSGGFGDFDTNIEQQGPIEKAESSKTPQDWLNLYQKKIDKLPKQAIPKRLNNETLRTLSLLQRQHQFLADLDKLIIRQEQTQDSPAVLQPNKTKPLANTTSPPSYPIPQSSKSQYAPPVATIEPIVSLNTLSLGDIQNRPIAIYQRLQVDNKEWKDVANLIQNDDITDLEINFAIDNAIQEALRHEILQQTKSLLSANSLRQFQRDLKNHGQFENMYLQKKKS
jgi:hypothetical protein